MCKRQLKKTEKISFKDMLKYTYKNDLWNYYSDLTTKVNKYLTEDYLSDSKGFIKAYIGIANKFVSDVKLTEFIDSLQEWRAQHVVSTFLTGCYLYDKCDLIQKAIKEKVIEPMKKLSDEETEPLRYSVKFQFLWFLICLFHDLGYKYEDGEAETDAPELPKDMIDNMQPPAPDFYSMIYKKYMEYRNKEHSKKDHGIYGGLRLYHDLCTVRKKEVDKLKSDNLLLHNFLNGEKLSAESFIQAMSKEDGKTYKKKNYLEIRKKRILGWHKMVEHSYNYAAWVILAHNIWYAKESDPNIKSLYEKYGLEKLILEEDVYPITLSEYPVLFLFCLVDTIEPIKRIKDIDLLKHIFLTIDKENKKIIIDIDDNLKCGCCDMVIKQASDLNDWLTPTMQRGTNSVEINLQGNAKE